MYNIKEIDNKMIVFKCDANSKEFDFLFYVYPYIKEVTIPSTIKIISPYAFSHSIIEKIIIPSNFTHIGNIVLFIYFCGNLRYFEFEKKSKLISIGAYAIHFSGFNQISLPNSVTDLNENSLKGGCKLLLKLN